VRIDPTVRYRLGDRLLPLGDGIVAYMAENEPADRPEHVLDDLMVEFPGWRIWRSKDHRGKPVDYVATLRDERAGRVPTLIATTAVRLREELAEQRDLVAGAGASQ
jgi:hypothetical protein